MRFPPLPPFLLVFCLMGFPLFSQSAAVSIDAPDFIGEYTGDAPAWLLRSWGRASREERKLSDAFLLLTRSLEKDPNNPETLTELALTYFASGDLYQAREYLNNALENRSRLSSPDLEYYVLYQLAKIYSHSEGSARDYERILLEIVSEDMDFISDDIAAASLRKNIRTILNRQPLPDRSSLDEVITLYRINDSFSLAAHVQLGLFYVHSGRYDEAQLHLIFAVVKIYTHLIQAIRRDDPLYSFINSEDLFNRIKNNDDFLSYMQEVNFDAAVYYLGAASYGFNPSMTFVYNEIWETLLNIPYSSAFTTRTILQLENPQKEDILYGSQQFLEEINSP